MNLSNALTLFRLVLVPAFLIALIYDRLVLALCIFLLAGVTDALDGFTARYLKQQTVLGAYLDPLADKLLMTVSYIAPGARVGDVECSPLDRAREGSVERRETPSARPRVQNRQR
jgi:phosphatidylglycerophosphate synthase